MKNNRPLETALQKAQFSEYFEESNVVQWLICNGRYLAFAFLALIALFAIGYRLTYGKLVKSEVNYINAENDYQRFSAEKNNEIEQKSLSDLNNLMAAHPELYAKYDGLIAQKLLAQGDFTKSLPFATRAIERTESENAPYFSDYSSTTLLIAEKKYEEALKKSINLKANLGSSNALLSAFNLLRIGMLQQQLHLEPEELSTWNEWKATKISDETVQKLVNNFNVGQISLNNYIEAREKILRKS